VLAALASSGAGITLITHDFALARAVSGRIILMHEGRVVRDLRPERFGELEMLAEGRA
jgi:ABC-type polar amino acid transport system ATPase subunit